MKDKILLFPNNKPCLEISICKTKGPNFNKEYGLNRDRYDNNLNNTSLEYAKLVNPTKELKQIVLEDLAYVYGRDTKKFVSKLKEFKIIK